MLLCSTILYLDENPVGYSVHKTALGYSFQPALTNDHNTLYPFIHAKKEEGEWIIIGTNSFDVSEQIKKLIEQIDAIDLQNTLSAAS